MSPFVVCIGTSNVQVAEIFTVVHSRVAFDVRVSPTRRRNEKKTKSHHLNLRSFEICKRWRKDNQTITIRMLSVEYAIHIRRSQLGCHHHGIGYWVKTHAHTAEPFADSRSCHASFCKMNNIDDESMLLAFVQRHK